MHEYGLRGDLLTNCSLWGPINGQVFAVNCHVRAMNRTFCPNRLQTRAGKVGIVMCYAYLAKWRDNGNKRQLARQADTCALLAVGMQPRRQSLQL